MITVLYGTFSNILTYLRRCLLSLFSIRCFNLIVSASAIIRDDYENLYSPYNGSNIKFKKET